MQCIAFDAHKQYTWALVEDEKGKAVCEPRIDPPLVNGPLLKLV